MCSQKISLRRKIKRKLKLILVTINQYLKSNQQKIGAGSSKVKIEEER